MSQAVSITLIKSCVCFTRFRQSFIKCFVFKQVLLFCFLKCLLSNSFKMSELTYKYAPYGKVGGFLTVLSILISGFYGAIFIYGPALPLMFIWPWLFRRYTEVLVSGWQTWVVALFEKIHGTKINVTGDSIERHEKTVVILNHRTRLDWMFFFSVVFHSKVLNRQKIALKSMLKFLPGAGWAMQVAAFIFLDRKWETDQEHINNILSYFVELESKPNILFFPEGTDLSDSNKQKSIAYAKKQGLPELQFVLQPRTKGFTYFVNTLRNISGIHAVHDVTVAYPYNITTSELQLLNGEFPREVHYHIKRYSIDELPEDENELAHWCQRKWEEKEKLLRDYYAVEDPALRKFKASSLPRYYPRTLILWSSIAVWCVFCLVCTLLLVSFRFVRWYAFMLCVTYVSIAFFFGEFTKMEMILYDMLQKPRKLWGLNNSSRNGVAGNKSGRNNYDSVYEVYDKYLSPLIDR